MESERPLIFDLQRDKTILENKMVAASDVLAHIEDPDWKNQKGTRAEGLRLDVAPRDKFGRLINVIAPMRRKLSEVLPRYQIELEVIDQKISQRFREASFGFAFVSSGTQGDNDFGGLKTSLAVGEYLGGLSDIKRGLLSEFLSSEQASVIMSNVAAFNLVDQDDNVKIRSILAGRIFEEIGHRHLKQKYEPSGVTVLSPDDIFNIGVNVYPNVELVDFQGISKGFKGITLPDGMIIREDQDHLVVEAIIEYKSIRSATPGRQYTALLKQLRNYTAVQFSEDLRLNGRNGYDMETFLGALINRLRPELQAKPLVVNPDMKVIYAVPENSDLSIPGVTIELVPLTTPELRRLNTLFIEEVPSFVTHMNTNDVMSQTISQSASDLVEDQPNESLALPVERLLSEEETRVFGILVNGLVTNSRYWWERLQADLEHPSRMEGRHGRNMYRVYTPLELRNLFEEAYRKINREAQTPAIQVLWTEEDHEIYRKLGIMTELLDRERWKVKGVVPRVYQKVKTAAFDFYANHPGRSQDYWLA